MYGILLTRRIVVDRFHDKFEPFATPEIHDTHLDTRPIVNIYEAMTNFYVSKYVQNKHIFVNQ